MKLEDLREAIMELLVELGSAELDDLAQRFGVSRMTIHRNLDDLETAGLLRKVQGGATIEASSRFESDYRWRQRQASAEKRLIARPELANARARPPDPNALPQALRVVAAAKEVSHPDN